MSYRNFKESDAYLRLVQFILGHGLIILILLLGIWARTWEFASIPPGLNQDEASIGLEAYDLLHFGMDRNGISFPVNFVGYGNGMDALYGYVLMPFVAFGLTPFTVRIPTLLSGIATLFLFYFVAKQIGGKKLALLATFFLAICPWHILLSRWGINENILPFVFLVGYFCFLRSRPNNLWFLAGSLVLGLSFYAYAAMYLAGPLFFIAASFILLKAKRVSLKNLFFGMLILGCVVAPLGLFVLANTFHMSSIHLGPLTIPRLPVEARYESMSAIFDENPLAFFVENMRNLFFFLLNQSDGLVWNTVEPFGYFYRFTFPIALLGAVLLIPWRKPPEAVERWLALCWLVAALSIGVMQDVNINRLHLVFLPLLLCMAFCVLWVDQRLKGTLLVMTCILLVCFSAFTWVYHSEDFRKTASEPFFDGLIPALDFARQAGTHPICVTDDINMPYVFVLFVEKQNPAQYLPGIVYVNPDGPFRAVKKLGRYTFGVKNCPAQTQLIYVLRNHESLEQSAIYHQQDFGNFRVYWGK